MAWMTRDRPGDRAWWVALALAVVFLAAHLPFLASTLEDVDSINFALGVRDFDPGQHQPHPPGYPIFIILAKAARLVASEPHALAFWAALFGALAALPLLRLFQALETMDRRPGEGVAAPDWWSAPVLATLVTVTAPLYWMTAVRPMSDTAGLAFALVAQALLATAFVRQMQDQPDTRGTLDPVMAARSGRLILAGAFVAALSIGVRSQALWLTAPLLVLVLVSRIGRGAAGALIGSTVWFLVGTLLWFVPLVMASGGPSAYLRALTAQAGEDWNWVALLITNPTPRHVAVGLINTFVGHWAGLGWFVMAAAVAGGLAAIATRRRACLVLMVAFGPYAIFHLLFQELVTTRYALPLLVPVAYLAVRGLWMLGRMTATAGVLACAVVALMQIVPVTAAYSRSGSPVSHAVADVSAEAGRVGPVVLGRRHAFSRALQVELNPASPNLLPVLPIKGRDLPPSVVVGPGAMEDWRLWRDLPLLVTADSPRPIWIFDTPQHLMVSLIDPSGLVVRKAYRWPFDAATFLGGVRPSDVDWIEVRQPSWVASEGWHLTPDTAGKAEVARKGLGYGPIEALVRARPGAAMAMVGGRHLGRPSDGPLVFSASVAGRVVDSWTTTQTEAFFLRFIRLPDGVLSGPGAWVSFTIDARSAVSGQASGLGAIDQFDVQDAGRILVGFDKGWHEQEFNPATGMRWRWSSDRADLRVQSAGQDVVLHIAGESPLRSFQRPSRITLRAGSRTLLDTTVSADFEWAVPVPAAALAESGGLVTMTADQTFRPADRGVNADRRVLGVRILSVRVSPAS